VVIGSAIVELVAEHRGEAAGPVRQFVASLAEVVHAARAAAAA
jgi:tryptophan synthase alpha chain